VTTVGTTTTHVTVFTCPAPELHQPFRVLREHWDAEQDPPIRYVHELVLLTPEGEPVSTMTTHELPSEPMTDPTSRLHAAVNALAVWDHNTGSGEDEGNTPEVLKDHWAGARAVWDALQPKYDDPAQLDGLPAGDTLVKHTRDGVYLWVKTLDRSLLWHPIVARGQAVGGAPLTGANILAVHGSVRLLWTGR
jgi:hypothetical protein